MRLYRGSAASPTTSNMVHRLLKLRWRKHAHCDVLGPTIDLNSSHLLVLHGLRPNLQLAIHHPTLPLPALPWKEAQRTTETYRLLRLRSRPAAPRYHFVYLTILLTTHGSCVLPHICMFTHGDHLLESLPRHSARMPQSFPAFCADVTN